MPRISDARRAAQLSPAGHLADGAEISSDSIASSSARQAVLEVVVCWAIVGPVDQRASAPPDSIGPSGNQRKRKDFLRHVAKIPRVVCEVEPGFPNRFSISPGTDRLVVVPEASRLRVALAQQAIEDPLPSARRACGPLAQRDRLGQVLVQAQRAGGAARDLQTSIIASAASGSGRLRGDEDLRLVLQAPEGVE